MARPEKTAVPTDEPPLACDRCAFEPAELAAWRAIGDRVVRGAGVRRDLPDGFAFEIARTPEALADVARFVELESRCCPFVDFAVRVPAGGGPIVLELTGRPGVKALLADELGLSPDQ